MMGPAELAVWALRSLGLYQRLMAIPAVSAWAPVLGFLLGVSGAFFLVSKALSYVALFIHRMLDHSLAELFAVIYNIVLAILYSSVLVYSITAERAGRDDFLAHQAAGFVIAYIMLGSAFSEPDGKISEYALPGYWAGLAVYLLFCVHSEFLSNPVTPRVYAWVAWAMRGWLGKAAVMVAMLRFAWQAVLMITRRSTHPLARMTPQRRPS
jgi:hypothetical protein